jgi:hypothetical protein
MKEANEATRHTKIVEGHRKTKAKLTNNIHADATLLLNTRNIVLRAEMDGDGLTQPFYQSQVPSLYTNKRERKMSHTTKNKVKQYCPEPDSAQPFQY